MAKQLGAIKITGTIEGLTYYRMRGEYYVRMKSSLTKKRFFKDRAFEGSRRSALLLAKASSLASRFYQTLSEEKKVKGVFNEITGRVKLLLKQGKEETQIIELLQQQCFYYPIERKEVKEAERKEIISIVSKGKQAFLVVCLYPGILFYQSIAVYQKKNKKEKLYYLKE
jgi:hypothetical protein